MRYLLLILLEHVLMGMLLLVHEWVSGIPEYIQKKMAITEVGTHMVFHACCAVWCHAIGWL